MHCLRASAFGAKPGLGRLARALPKLGFGRACGSSWACLETPNPNVRKFEAAEAAAAEAAAARSRLLSLEGVRDVFVAGEEAPWLAVTRAEGASWEALVPRVQEVLEALPRSPSLEAASSSGASAGAEEEIPVTASGTEAEILEILAHRVRPSVQADGGDVALLRWDAATGEVLLQLRGACRGCPQSAVTLQETILRTLKHYVPEVRSVAAEEEQLSSDTEDPCADIPWEHHGEPDPQAIQALAAAGTPFFSTFAGMKVEGPKLRRVRFLSRIELNGRTPEHIFVSCPDCKARRTIEDPQDILRKDKGNTTGNAAVVICPTCCVLVTP